MPQTQTAIVPQGRDYWSGVLGFNLSHSRGGVVVCTADCRDYGLRHQSAQASFGNDGPRLCIHRIAVLVSHSEGGLFDRYGVDGRRLGDLKHGD